MQRVHCICFSLCSFTKMEGSWEGSSIKISVGSEFQMPQTTCWNSLNAIIGSSLASQPSFTSVCGNFPSIFNPPLCLTVSFSPVPGSFEGLSFQASLQLPFSSISLVGGSYLLSSQVSSFILCLSLPALCYNQKWFLLHLLLLLLLQLLWWGFVSESSHGSSLSELFEEDLVPIQSVYSCRIPLLPHN